MLRLEQGEKQCSLRRAGTRQTCPAVTVQSSGGWHLVRPAFPPACWEWWLGETVAQVEGGEEGEEEERFAGEENLDLKPEFWVGFSDGHFGGWG